MYRSSLILFTTLFVPGIAIAVQDGGSAPDRVVKFFEVSFADPPNWSCRRAPMSDEDASAMESSGAEPSSGHGAKHSRDAAVTPSGGPEESCLDCTMTGTGSGDIVVTKAQDGTQETIADSTEAEICADVLLAKTASDETPSPTAGGEEPVNSGVPATPA